MKVRYSVQFRASPDITDPEGRNKFIEWDDDDPPYGRIKDRIEQQLQIDFGWVCRQISADDLLRSAEPLELMGQCILKLKTPPHEDKSFIKKRIKDADLVQFYISNRDGIMSLYGKELLRPILAVIAGQRSGRYFGQPLDADGHIANPRFHAELSDIEQLLGIEILDLQVAVDCSPLFMMKGRAMLGS